MRASRPATRPAFSGLKIFAAPADPLASRRRRLGGLDPAYPFIAGERRNVSPSRQRYRVGYQRRFKVHGQIMDHTARDVIHLGHERRPPACRGTLWHQGFSGHGGDATDTGPPASSFPRETPLARGRRLRLDRTTARKRTAMIAAAEAQQGALSLAADAGHLWGWCFHWSGG